MNLADAGHPEICLFQPEIPQNTGAIGRLAAATRSKLHLIKPLGFDINEKNVRRPGLDYWPYLDLTIHENCLELFSENSHQIAFFSKKSSRPYFELPKTAKLLVFGQETRGLPDFLWETYAESFYTIPMYHPEVRSLNLATSVAIVLYHQLHARKGLI